MINILNDGHDDFSRYKLKALDGCCKGFSQYLIVSN